MATFLERYLEGQCVDVWNELVELGDRVREKPVLADAVAVADETMRRARNNAEILLPRLAAKGYQFADRRLEHQLWMVNRVLSKIEAAQGKRDSELPSRQQEKAEIEIEIERMRTRPPLDNPRVFAAPDEDTVNEEEQTANYIDLIQRRVKGPMPISLEIWYRHMSCISLVGSHEILNPSENPIADPLAVASLPDFYTSLCYALPGEKKLVALSSDDLAKAWLPARGPVGRSSIQYQVSIPNAAADFQVENEWRGTYFVNYLRLAFEWGGFPGWERDSNPPRAIIAELADGLLPI